MLDLQKTLYGVLRKKDALDAKKALAESERVRLLLEVKKAQERMNAAESVQTLLEYVQHKEHERAVGAYEDLLGAFLSDVLPGQRQVSMDLYTERGSPALDIFIQKGENSPREDALKGTGGSVTNLLSTGLRLVALLRSRSRRFLVLDESDCWIEPALIPRYAGIVSEMAETLDVQILMISHHQESLFSGHIPHRLKMVKTGPIIDVEWTPTSDLPEWDEDQHGLRSIVLRHFQSHQHTTIPLSPLVTLLQGANDIGKSAVVNALHAVFDGESSDALIQHHKSQAEVMLDFGPENILTWTRFRKGKVKVNYRLTTPENVTLHASDGTKVPEWLIEQAQIGKIEGLDVQIGQQQDPVFLLNQPPSTRAKALAIGMESGHVHAMIAQDKQETNDAKQTIKNGEKELERLRNQLHVVGGIADISFLQDQLDSLTGFAQQNEKAHQLLKQWKTATKISGVLEGGAPLPSSLPSALSTQGSKLLLRWKKDIALSTTLDLLSTSRGPVFPVLQTHLPQNILGRWKKAHDKQIALQVPAQNIPALPEKSSKAGSFLTTWKKLALKNNILKAPEQILLPMPIPAMPAIAHCFLKWQLAESELQQKVDRVLESKTEEQEVLKTFYDHFSTCPTCGHAWEKNAFKTWDGELGSDGQKRL